MEGTTGSTFHVPTDVLLDVPIPGHPDFEEQVSVSLRHFDWIDNPTAQFRALRLRRSRLANDLKRATMHTLFTRGLRGESQKETEIGPVPESWGVVDFASKNTRETLSKGMVPDMAVRFAHT